MTGEVLRGQVEHLLQMTDIRKIIGPDDISSQVLKNCASEQSGPLSEVFEACLEENTWPLV